MAIIHALKCTVLFSFVVPLVVTRCHSLSFVVTRYHSSSLVVTRCHSLSHSLSFVVPLVVIRCHSLSFVVTRCTTRCHSLSLVVTQCTTRLSFYKRSISEVLKLVHLALSRFFLMMTLLHYINVETNVSALISELAHLTY